MFTFIGNVKVGTKLIAGFLLVAAIAAFIGIMGISSTAQMNGFNDELFERRLQMSQAMDAVALDIASVRIAARTMQSASDEVFKKQVERFETSKASYEENIATVKKLAISEQTKELLVDLEKSWNEFISKVTVVRDSTPKYKATLAPEYSAILEATLGPATKSGEIASALMDINKGFATQLYESSTQAYKSVRVLLIALVVAGVLLGIGIGYYLAVSLSKPLTQTVKMLKDLSSGHLGTRLRMKRGDEIGVMAATMDTFADDLQNQIIGTMKQIADGDLSANLKAVDAQDEIRPALANTIEALRGLIIEDGGKVLEAAAEKDLSQRLTREYRGEYAKMKNNINALVDSLDEALQQVTEAVGQVTSASGQISQGSQSLAEGANEQASSLEEVSSSLEEMSSMTKQNADNSNTAKNLMGEAGTSINEADEAMKRMSTAIHEIKTSSDNTAKILKTIDDIAFQTNLLALNAAVEAARAGEAGKGFAVVAEEVRNLAMRSAEAAKNTANMIEESVKNAESGVKITDDVAKALQQTVEVSTKVSDLISEIAAASNEQAQGIEQVNTAVASMNAVTQQNAANSEESASAAEELSSQASELASMVGTFTLSTSAGAKRPNRAAGTAQLALPGVSGASKSTAIIPLGGGLSKGGIKSPSRAVATVGKAPALKTKALTAEAVIPLDDGDLGDF